MAKQSANDRQGTFRTDEKAAGTPELSLESILAEYLSAPRGERSPERAPEAARTSAEDGYEVLSSQGYDSRETYPEDAADGADYADDYAEAYPEDYAEDPAGDYPDDGDEDGDVKIYAPAQSEDEDEDVHIYRPAPARAQEDEPETDTEGYEDDGDFYGSAPPESPEEAGDGEEPAPARRSARRGNVLQRLHSGLLALLAVAALRRQRRREEELPEPEDPELEMPARKAARYYARQMPALRLRALAALGVCLLMLWMTLSCCNGWPLPGRLQTDIKLCSLVCAVAELTVMLIGLDVITTGIMSLVRGRPGGETLIAAACLASLADVVSVAVTGGGERGLPPCAAPALAVAVALWAAWLSCQGYRHTFLALHHAREPYSLTSEKVEGRKERYLIKSRLSPSGFVRRSEEPNMGEALSAAAAPFLLLGSLALALLLTLGSGDTGAFFRILALLTALCASFTWLAAFPLFFARASQGLLRSGAAVAGWSGARDIGMSRHLILTDTDVFPEGSLEITGIRILNKQQADKIISCTGSLLSAAGTGMASTFAELMRIGGNTMLPVEEFTAGEGGVKAFIQGEEIHVGSAGYMHLSGVKLPSKLKLDSAIYTAVGKKLCGVFLFNYRALPAVQNALTSLRRGRRKPIFAMRDFNVDPLLISRRFGVSSEWFEFPAGAERYRISAIPASGNSPVAGVMAGDGLNNLVNVSERGVRMYEYGRLCAVASLVSALLGAALLALPVWQGAWQLASAANVVLYMLLWLLPMCLLALDLRK